jgi:hypothetical protein
LAFTDVVKAYDNINRQEILKALQRTNVSEGINICDKCKTIKIIDGKTSEFPDV